MSSPRLFARWGVPIGLGRGLAIAQVALADEQVAGEAPAPGWDVDGFREVRPADRAIDVGVVAADRLRLAVDLMCGEPAIAPDAVETSQRVGRDSPVATGLIDPHRAARG